MTRKHFRELVKILADNSASRQMVRDIMSMCARDNERFCEKSFMDALADNGWNNWQGLV